MGRGLLDAHIATFELCAAKDVAAPNHNRDLATHFLRLVDLLLAQGVTTLGRALEVSEELTEIRRRQAEF